MLDFVRELRWGDFHMRWKGQAKVNWSGGETGSEASSVLFLLF